MKVTKAKCLNTHLARHLLSKSSRFRGTAQFRPFPLGLTRRGAASHFWQFQFASLDGERFGLNDPSEAFVERHRPDKGDLRSMSRNATKGPRGNGPMTAAIQRPRQFAAKRSSQMCVEALCFGDFHLCQQMKVTRPPGRNPATNKVNQTFPA